MSLNYNDSLDKLLVGINDKYKAWNTSTTYKPNGMDMTVKSGRKFDKVISDNSVWGFVAKKDGLHKGLPFKEGDVFKPAGWAAAAKHVRGSILHKGLPFKEGDVFKPAGWAAAAKHVRGSIYDTNTDWYAWTGPNYLI